MTDEPEQAKPTSREEEMVGDAIPEVFDPKEPAARLVVSMAMARNDIDRAFHDLLRSDDEDRQDFTYRVRLLTGHLVEALDALAFYREAFPQVRKLIGRVSSDGKKDLKIAAGTKQKAGKGALDDVRDNTFHYPSPDPRHKAMTSDEKLGQVLALMTDRGVSVHMDGDTRALTMSFADEAALELSMGRPSTTMDEARRRSEVARDGALAFHRWVNALIEAYMKATGADFGEPILSEKKKRAGRAYGSSSP
jgi:hypothetical protein